MVTPAGGASLFQPGPIVIICILQGDIISRLMERQQQALVITHSPHFLSPPSSISSLLSLPSSLLLLRGPVTLQVVPMKAPLLMVQMFH